MLGALIIVFREVLEAGLIIGIILAATKSVPHRGRWISFGVIAGFLGACLVAAFAGFISQQFHGSGQELFNFAILSSAVVMLAWHNIWMATHGREMANDAQKFGAEISAGRRKLGAMAAVVAIAVLREGSEVVLFMYGLLASNDEGWRSVFLGGLVGLALGALSTGLLYLGLVAIPVRHFFQATSILLTFLAAGLGSQAVSFLQQAGYLEAWSSALWNTSNWLPETSWPGRILHTLVGYSDQPSAPQVGVYLAILISIAVLTKWAKRSHQTQKATA